MDATKINAKQVARDIMPLVNRLLVATVKADMTREQTNAMDREILTDDVYNVSHEHAERRPNLAERITDPKRAYMMSDKDAARYYAIREARIAEDGWNVPTGHCPACIDEMKMIDLENSLINATFVAIGEDKTSNDVYGNTRDKMLKLCIGLATSHRLLSASLSVPGYTPPTGEER